MRLKWKKAKLFVLALSMVFTTSLWPGNNSAYAAEEDVEISKENFPDLELRMYVTNLDKNGDGRLSADEIKEITTVSLDDKHISDLKGFEYLTSATTLSIKGHNIKNLDLSGYTWLEEVHCQDSSTMTSLDVSGCKNLRILWCYNTSTNGVPEFSELSALTLGNHPKLELLACYNTKVSSLDLSQCPNLKTLPVNYNPYLTSLDVSACTALENLYCYENSSLTELILGTHPNLINCICYNTKITKLDLSKCPNIEQVVCYSSGIKELTLGNHASLNQLICHENKIEEINLSGCQNLTQLTLFSNQLTNLDVSACTKLQTLHCHDNKLTKLDISNCLGLTSFSCHWNRLPSLDLSSNTAGFNSLTTVSQDKGQEIDGVLYKTEDGFYIDLADGLLDKSKVTQVEKGTYDSTTGRIYLVDPMKIGETVTYYYDTNGTLAVNVTSGTPIMKVEVTITAIMDLTEPTTEEPTTEEPITTEEPTIEDNSSHPADVNTPTTEGASDTEVTTTSEPAAKTGDEAMPFAIAMLCIASAGCLIIVKKKKSEE